MYTLIIENRQGRSAAEISFDQGSYTIGRVDGNDVVLPSNSVSRTHARIFVSNNKCYIDDLGSANGVFVNGNQIRERTEINNGSKIRIGEYTLYLEYKDQSESAGTQDVLKTQIVSQGQAGYKIVRIADKFAGEEFMLTDAANTIGRTEDNYILLSDQSISRNHANITILGNTFSVKDLGSSNGTFVNGKRVNGDTAIQPGDQIRFGNVSFVFVPATQQVDPRIYARKNNSDKKTITIVMLIFAVFVIIIVVTLLIVSFVGKKNSNNRPHEAEVTQEVTENDLNTKLDEADRLFKDKHFAAAKSVLTPLKETWPEDQRLLDIEDKIDFEIEMEKFINKGNAMVDEKQYEQGIELFKEVTKKSINYDTAQKYIQETEARMRIISYNKALSLCDSGVTEECITELCTATIELGNTPNEIEKTNNTVSLLERVVKKKSNPKNVAAAKKCLRDLRQ